MRECCRAAVEASFAVENAVEVCREFIYFPPVSKDGGFLWRGPRTLPLPSVLDAYFIFFYGTCGDRKQVRALHIFHVVDDRLDACLLQDFKVSALLPSEDAK
jgi:hypothetical protein